ncbi:MAG: beta strand repeat-containing protein, partial [Steroidobacteraceae bacterium]
MISTDPGGSLSLTSDTQLDVEGVLRAPGGGISLTLQLPDQSPDQVVDASYDPSQAIWLGPSAVLDASGAALIFPNAAGNPTGSVLPGGTVSLDASPGYLELLPGSVIDVSGTSGTVDLAPPGRGLAEAQRIASAGGEIDLSSSDGAVIGGTLLGAAGTAGSGANQPGGGSLYVSENTVANSDTSAPNGMAGAATSVIRVIPTLTPTIVAPGSSVPDSLEGLTLLPTNALAQAGFSIIALTSGAVDQEHSAYGSGEIELSGGASLSASREVSLDASTYTVDAGTAGSIEAPYVEFGNSSTAPYIPDITSGTGVLNVSGGFIELYGTSLLDGIGAANFDSSGDLRLRGLPVSPGASALITGALDAEGTINLTAQQIYPTTLTQFTISADPPWDPSTSSESTPPTSGAIVIQGSEGPATDLLSAGGSLTLVAASITQDGVLRAPFGTIALDATSLTLGAGSLTSTSADGLTIPFGTTQGNTQGGAQNTYDWTYSLDGFTVIYGTDGQPLPSQNVELNAANVDVQSRAVIDISGGGDLQAYEWIPGTGGTRDVLGCNNCYAIIPSLHTNVAPYDPGIASTAANPTVGDAVYLSAGSGVPAGTYTLLPARYALLPGAYLVTPATGYQDIQPGQSFTAPDGGTIVSGYLAATGLPFGSSRLSGFDVTPASVFLNEAQYNLTTGNQFFSGQEGLAAAASAANEALSAMRLPEDAGVLAINASSFLTLDGTLRATTAQNSARGGEVVISNQNIVVAASGSDASQTGALVLTSSSLNQLGAQTLVLGGTDSDGTIATAAQTITILNGASLTVPQLLLTAQQQIAVQSGASLTATGTGPSAGVNYSLVDLGTSSNDGAFLGLSAGPQITVSRSGAANVQGTLDLAAGSSLNAGSGSVYLEATAGISTSGSIALSGGSLAVQAPVIALGNATSASGAAVLGANVLGGGGLTNLLLMSPAAILIADGAAANAQNITIDAPGLTSNLTAGQTAALNASAALTLGDSMSAGAGSANVTSNPPATSASGSLVLSGSTIVLGDNLAGATSLPAQQVAIAGFGSVAMNAQDTVTAAYNIALSTDSNLSISASHLTTAAGVTASLEAGYVDSGGNFQPEGSVSLLSPTNTTPLSSAAALGGSLTVKGSSIEIGTDLNLPSGLVSLLANDPQSGGIEVDSGGSIDVAGVVQRYGSDAVATPGGTVLLSATGAINLLSGSSISVSAGTGGEGGSLSISAPTGVVTAQGTLAGVGTQQGGSFSVDAQSLGGGGFGALSTAVNAGGFTSSQAYWLQGSQSLTLADGATLRASTVLLEADQGSIDIEGTIDASGSSGGSVRVAGAEGIILGSAAVIDAQATSQGGNGGAVELDLGNSNPAAALTLNQGSRINVSGGGPSESQVGPGATAMLPGSGGAVLLRLPYLTVENVANGLGGVTLAGQISGASHTVLEAYNTYQTAGDVTLQATDTSIASAYYTDAQNFMTGYAATATAALNPAAAWNFTLEPGVEIDDATGGITLGATWDLSKWRFPEGNNGATVPGILTLRAAGSVTFDDSLSDGFTKPNGGKLVTPGTSSWSYRIAAGADLNAANPLAVGSNVAGDVTIGGVGAGALVRTGTGFIDVAASGNFSLSALGSVLYTAGTYDDPNIDPPAPAPTCGGGPCADAPTLPPYTVGGGDVSIDVAGDIQGATGTNQFVNDWLWRQGGQTQSGALAPTAWSVQFTQFDQGTGVAALGGGDVTIRAGGDIQNLSASIASIGIASGGGGVAVKGGGDLTVSAGGSIFGGLYYVGLGSATLSAGDAIGIGTGQLKPASPLIALGEASVSLTAREDVEVSGILNPTLLNSGSFDEDAGESSEDYFSTYGSASSASLTSIGGNITLDDESGNMAGQYASTLQGHAFGSTATQTLIDGDPAPLVLVAPLLTLASLSGDVNLSRPVMSFPSSQDVVQVFAGQNITFARGNLAIPDVDPTAMPSIANPQQGVTSIVNTFPISTSATFTEEHGSS